MKTRKNVTSIETVFIQEDDEDNKDDNIDVI